MESLSLLGKLEFIRSAERLKNTLRSGYTSQGRSESVAEHTWRLSLMAMVFEEHFPDVRFDRLIKICIVHDLGEALHGDIPAPEQERRPSKVGQEREDFMQLTSSLPEDVQNEFVALWDEYEDAATPEARLAKALDKLETILQHNQGKNPDSFDYRFNLEYGKKYTAYNPVIAWLRKLLDEETERQAQLSER